MADEESRVVALWLCSCTGQPCMGCDNSYTEVFGKAVASLTVYAVHQFGEAGPIMSAQ